MHNLIHKNTELSSILVQKLLGAALTEIKEVHLSPRPAMTACPPPHKETPQDERQHHNRAIADQRPTLLSQGSSIRGAPQPYYSSTARSKLTLSPHAHAGHRSRLERPKLERGGSRAQGSRREGIGRSEGQGEGRSKCREVGRQGRVVSCGLPLILSGGSGDKGD